MPARFVVIIGSKELSMPAGSAGELEQALASLDREQVAKRVVNLLSILAVPNKSNGPALSAWYLSVLPDGPRKALNRALLEDKDRAFLEPFQLMLVLKRALAVAPMAGATAVATPEGEALFFNACRCAADLLYVGDEGLGSGDSVDDWLRVSASFMQRMGLANPENMRWAIARFEVMFRKMPSEIDEVRNQVAAIEERFPKAFDGLSFRETTTLIAFLALWSQRFKTADIIQNPSIIHLNPKTFLKETEFTEGTLSKLLDRCGRLIAAKVDDKTPATSLVAFRDRPFLGFSDGSFAPVYPSILREKLASDLFWWLKDLDEEQARTWQTDFGQIAEAYVLRVLARASKAAGVEFLPRVKGADWEIDGILRCKGHIGLIEISASSLREAEATSGDPAKLGSALTRVLVEAPSRRGDGIKNEAVGQLVRDVRLLLSGNIPQIGSIQPTRIYPIVVAADRRISTPGVVRFLQHALVNRLTEVERLVVAPLAVWGLDDVEIIEGLVAGGFDLHGTPRGPLKLLRKWDLAGGRFPSWWQFIEHQFGQVDRTDELVAAFGRWKENAFQYMKRGTLKPE